MAVAQCHNLIDVPAKLNVLDALDRRQRYLVADLESEHIMADDKYQFINHNASCGNRMEMNLACMVSFELQLHSRRARFIRSTRILWLNFPRNFEEFIQINIMIHILRFGYWNNNKTEKKISECEAAAAANQNQKLYLLEKKIIIKIYAGMCLFTILKRLALTKLSANQIEHDHSRDATHCFISIVYNEI